jgi:glycosyltransferase involved in cell wall biosynthesis
MTLVFLSDIAWDNLHQRPQHIASRLAAGATVLWVEPATLGRERFWTPAVLGPRLFRLTVPMFPLNARNHVVRRLAFILSRLGFLRVLLEGVAARLLRRALKLAAPGGEPPAFLVQNFQAGPLAGDAGGGKVVFDYIDDAFGFAPLPPHVTAQWRWMLHRADILTATSPTLARRMRDASGREAVVIPNGVEFDRFLAGETAPRPADIPSRGPVIGYIGSVYPWLDYPLLEHAADALPGAHFVIVGHAHPDVEPALQRLRQRSNVSILGLRPYGAIPAYCAAFDAAIIPFRRNALTEGVNPVKLYEYSAAGVTSVVTDFSPDLRAFASHILIAATPEEFVLHLRTAVDRRHDPERVAALRAFARTNDWNDRAAAFARLLFHPPHR